MYERNKNFSKIILALFSVALIVTTLATGTLAVFSATYTWQSNEGTVGIFDYSDTTLSINLFGENPIYPANSGYADLTGADFKDNTLTWGFAESNESSLPVLYYVNDGSANSGFYSSYAFAANFPTYYLKLDESNYVACSSISTQSSALAAEFAIGFKVCWVWPDKIYSENTGTYGEVSGVSAVDDYIANNEAICKSITSYSYNDSKILTQLANSSNKLTYIANATVTDGYSISAVTGANITVANDKLYLTSAYLPIYSAASSNFVIPAVDYTPAQGDYYLFYSTALSASTLINNLSTSEINYQIVGNTAGNTDFTPYYRNVDYTQIVATSNGETEKPIVKIFPTQFSQSSVISVTITAEVSV